MRFTVRCGTDAAFSIQMTVPCQRCVKLPCGAVSQRAGLVNSGTRRGVMGALRYRSQEHRGKQRCSAVPHRPCGPSSSAHHSPLLDIGLSNCSPSRWIFGYSHLTPTSRSAQIVTPPGLRESHTTLTETRSPLQNLSTPSRFYG
jgi:hypothetical protein